MKNTMNNDMTMVLDPGDLIMVNGGVMDESQKNKLIGYTTVFVRFEKSEQEAFSALSYIVKHGGSFPGVTEEELAELIHLVYEGVLKM